MGGGGGGAVDACQINADPPVQTRLPRTRSKE